MPGFEHTCLMTSLILLGTLLWQTLREYRVSRRKESWIPAFITFQILLALLLDGSVGRISQPASFLTIIIVIVFAQYYLWLHLQFVREHEQALQMEQRVQLMLSQIKPHFLYNALGSIEALCTRDPKAARQATHMFSQYLRGNMNSISGESMIPFETELQHTRLYLELEQIRFGDALRVEYDIMAVNRKSQLWITLLFTALLLCALLFCAGAMAEEMPSAERTAETVETQDKTDGEAIPGEDDAQDSPAAEEEPAPVGEEAVPVEEESVPAEEEPLPVEEEPAPAEEEAVLTEEEFVPIEEEPLPVEEEPAPVEEESAPPQDKGYLVISDGTQVFYDSELTALYATVSENCTVYARIERELPGSWYVFRISFDTEASKTEENCLRGYVKIQGTPWAEIEPADGRILDDVRIPVIRKIFPPKNRWKQKKTRKTFL